MQSTRYTTNHQINIHAIYRAIKKEFEKHKMPVVDIIKIRTKDPFKVLISTILSSRTKDATTTKATNRLFAVVKSLEDLQKISQKKIEKLIYPVGFYNNKAKQLKEIPNVINKLYYGIIPQTVEELLKLPGVGRKTANLVVSVGFNKPAICVDTHVHRISNRLGYVRTKTPLETEMRLREILPKRYWITINSLLVSFGQNICFPINPKCKTCPIFNLCNRVNVVSKYI